MGQRGLPLPARRLAHPHLPRLLHRHRPLRLLRGQEQLQDGDPSSHVSISKTIPAEYQTQEVNNLTCLLPSDLRTYKYKYCVQVLSVGRVPPWSPIRPLEA